MLEVTIRHNGSPEGISFVRAYQDAVRQAQSEQRIWLAELRARGIRGAMADDGWVDRQKNVFSFSNYAPMPALCAVDDVVALGRPEQWRAVRIVEVIPPNGLITWNRYRFEEVKLDL